MIESLECENNCQEYRTPTAPPADRNLPESEMLEGVRQLISCGVVWSTTQAQRPGPRDAGNATGARWPGSLQRICVRPHGHGFFSVPIADPFFNKLSDKMVNVGAVTLLRVMSIYITTVPLGAEIFLRATKTPGSVM